MVRRVILAAIVSMACVNLPVPALRAAEGDAPAAKKSELDAVYDFVAKHLIGKVLEDRVVTKIGEGKIETEFQRRTLYLRLERSGGEYPSMSFDAIILIKQTNYDLGPDGKRLPQAPLVKNRSLVFRYSFEERRSTGRLVGSSVAVSSSVGAYAGSGEAIELSLDGEKLRMEKRTPLYYDGFAPGGKETPAASTTTQEFSTVDGKLVSLTHEVGYLVDPVTLERKPSGHNVKMNGQEIPSLY